MKKVVSFDIFDTCLVRTTGSPDVVFELLAKTIVENGSSADIFDFIKIRKDGELRARMASEKEEIRIEEIYEHCDFSFVTDASKQFIISTELDIEESVLLPVLTIREKIDFYRLKGYSICFISDMYLPEFFVLRILTKYGFFKDGDRLLLSSVFNVTKSSGNLYKVFRNYFPKSNIFNWRHHGDNIYSDFIESAKQGAIPELISHKYNERESITIQPFDPIISSELKKYTSISKALRLSTIPNSQYIFAVDVIAPMYVSFVMHILNLAKEKGITELYFFARDGFLFYQIALQLQDIYEGLHFHYIYISRKVIYFSTLKDVSFESLKQLFSTQVTLSNVLNYLFLEKEDLSTTTFEMLKNEDNRDKILNVLCADEVLVDKISKNQEKQKQLFLRYLQQEGLTSNTLNSAIVDLRGTRKSHELVNNFLLRNGYNRLFGFYYEVIEERATPQNCDSYYSCIFREQYKGTQLYEALENFTSIFEQYFSVTSQQRTSHYKLLNEKVEPVFENELVRDSIRNLFELNVKACMDFCHYSKLLVSKHNTDIITRVYLSNFLISLSRYEKDLLRLFCDFEISENQFNKKVFVKKISIFDFKNHQHIMWFKGSIVYTFGRLPYYLIVFKRWIKRKIFK